LEALTHLEDYIISPSASRPLYPVGDFLAPSIIHDLHVNSFPPNFTIALVTLNLTSEPVAVTAAALNSSIMDLKNIGDPELDQLFAKITGENLTVSKDLVIRSLTRRS